MFLFSNSPWFFWSLHIPKLQKPQNKIKHFFTSTRKQIKHPLNLSDQNKKKHDDKEPNFSSSWA
jgi:hypothetical protein